MEKLRRNLEALFDIRCTLVFSSTKDGGSNQLEVLRETDVALFFVEQQSPPPDALAEIKRFVDSEKGVIAIGSRVMDGKTGRPLIAMCWAPGLTGRQRRLAT